MGGVDPAVPAPPRVVDDCVGVAGTEIAVEFFDLVGFAVVVGVAEPEDVRGLGDDDPVFVEDETGDEIEPFEEDGLLVHDPVAVGVGETGDFIETGAALFAWGGVDAAVVLPFLAAVVRAHAASTVRVFRGFGDPERTVRGPIEVHGLRDERLGGDEFEVEIGMDFEVCEGGVRLHGAAVRVGEAGDFLWFGEFVDVVAFPGPCETAHDDGAVVGEGEGFVEVAGDADEGAVGLGAAFDGAFVGPHLGLDVVDVGFAAFGLFAALGDVRRVAAGEDLDFREVFQVVVDFVVEVEVAGGSGDGVAAADVLILGVIEVHGALAPFGGAWAPCAADDGFPVIGLFGDGGGVEDDETAAAFEVGFEGHPAGGWPCAAFLGVEEDDVGASELFVGGEIGAAFGFHAAFGEEGGPFAGEARVGVDFFAAVGGAAADVDPEGVGEGREHAGGGQQD